MEELLPKAMDVKVDLTDLNKLDYDEEVKTCRNLFKTIRDGGIDVLMRLLRIHEALVHKKLPGKSWSGFCKDLGIDRKTPLNWFARHSLPYTKRKRIEETSSVPKPTRKHKESETKEQSEEIAKEAGAKAGTAAGSPAPVAMKHVGQGSTTLQPGKHSDVEELLTSMGKTANQLRYLVDGTMPILDADGIHIKAIKRLGPDYIYCFSKLGVDLPKVYDFTEGPDQSVQAEKSLRGDEGQSEDLVNVQCREVPSEQKQLGLWPQA
ncbi:MAG: hypothetical protein SWQ30_02760 [Thermodesulfobacteriota bacterium]|nr:hypothetical protein [Thermodesulfobacteriota bacterium]